MWKREAVKDVIVGALMEYGGAGQGVDDMLYDVASGQADKIIEALDKFGFVLSVHADADLQEPKR